MGTNTPTHCETVEPITFPLSTHVTLVELIHEGAHFRGTVTIPPLFAVRDFGRGGGPLLTSLMSGPDNPYALFIGA